MRYALTPALASFCLQGICFFARRTGDGQNPDRCQGVRGYVLRIPPERASYLAKYLSKQRPECFKGWRLWAGFGEWEWTKFKDVVFDSLFCRIYRACKEAFSWKGNNEFRNRMRLVQWLEIRTITEGWKDGLGPSEKPYSMCCYEELFDEECNTSTPL